MEQEDILKDKIEAYLSGEMPEAQKAAFESEIDADPALREQVEWQQVERDAMEILAEDDLRRDLADWQAQLPAPSGRRSGRRFFIGGVIVALALVSWWYSQREPEQLKKKQDTPADSTTVKPLPVDTGKSAPIAGPVISPAKQPEPKHRLWVQNELRDNIYRPRADEPLIRNAKAKAAQGAASAWQKGLVSYSDGKYGQAIQWLGQVQSGDSAFIQATELLAHAYLNTGQYSRAVPQFRRVADANKNPYSERAQWYILLAYLGAGQENTPDFQKALQEILSDPEHDFYPKAENLSQQLKASTE